ncbi:MAG: L-aspartate oxidase [bacterium]
MRTYVDFLVIGSGVAGLTFALKAAKHGKVCIVTKQKMDDTATSYAQGGIAAVMYTPDSYEKHLHDTIVAGDGLCNEKIARLTITESTERIKELIRWGAKFDKTQSGRYDLAKEGGHSEYRVLHHKDSTGKEIEDTLIDQVRKHPNIEVLENDYAIDIITQHHLGVEVNIRTSDVTCYGAYVLNPRSRLVDTILAKVTLIATGGAGNIYSNTTNPTVSTGDGIAMVYRAMGIIENMEFIQFHPTALFNPQERPSFLITEALRGFGGVLKTYDGKEFMHKYDARLSLASRDIVARAIDNELKISGEDFVYLDCRHLNKNDLIRQFPRIYAKCLSVGIDITRDLIPVVPAAHYICGGIKTDEFGHTTIRNLYASGECACTGMHGANRLASNSLLESVVFSHRASEHALQQIKTIDYCNAIPDWNAEGMVLTEEMVLITQSQKELQAIMSNYVGIVRSNLRLQRAFDRLELLYSETEDLYDKSILTPRLCELRNMINVAYLVIKQAIARKENRGLHYSLDYPKH